MLVASATVARTVNEDEFALREAGDILVRAAFEQIVRVITLAPPVAVVAHHAAGNPLRHSVSETLTPRERENNERAWARSPPSAPQLSI
jgi:hypothetical protein